MNVKPFDFVFCSSLSLFLSKWIISTHNYSQVAGVYFSSLLGMKKTDYSTMLVVSTGPAMIKNIFAVAILFQVAGHDRHQVIIFIDCRVARLPAGIAAHTAGGFKLV